LDAGFVEEGWGVVVVWSHAILFGVLGDSLTNIVVAKWVLFRI
jgi:hypothetical protein